MLAASQKGIYKHGHASESTDDMMVSWPFVDM
jgi:hypothetical protein